MGRETVYLCYDFSEVLQNWRDRIASETQRYTLVCLTDLLAAQYTSATLEARATDYIYLYWVLSPTASHVLSEAAEPV